MRPFCRLVLKAVRRDSPPFEFNGQPLRKFLVDFRLQADMTQETMAANLGVSAKTLKNWEAGRTTPTRKLWPCIYRLKAVLGH